MIFVANISLDRKNILFISEELKAYSLESLLLLEKSKEVKGLRVIYPIDKAPYIRMIQNKSKSDNLGSLSIANKQLWRAYKDINYRFSNPITQKLEKIRNGNITPIISKDTLMILGWNKAIQDYSIRIPSKTRTEVRTHITRYKSAILQAANFHKIDVYMLASILVDEYCRLGPDDWLDWLGVLGFDTSIGLAQIKIETAKSVIKKGLYTPEKGLDFESILGREKLLFFLTDPTHSINFCAAIIRNIIDRWKYKFDLAERPDLVGTLYSLSNPPAPHAHPRSNKRGIQIQTEFYPLVKEILG